ncbi:hypothetical protein ZIOFF_051010 [Zingiber officinale]|uniref:Uncharacterized protein n=1 Tax=Zingiber officinale TaxID=94328 RepID=A0A8J5FL56_ZINOF|nr:hypothetical protein ZIOFF_051010 [Zingiber officinale]
MWNPLQLFSNDGKHQAAKETTGARRMKMEYQWNEDRNPLDFFSMVEMAEKQDQTEMAPKALSDADRDEGGSVRELSDANEMKVVDGRGDGGFAAEADADTSGSTSTEDQASYASASFVAPFPDDQPTGYDPDLTSSPESPQIRMSWADMAQEDKLKEAVVQEEKTEESGRTSIEGAARVKREIAKKETGLSREQREEIHFRNVVRKKDFICLERVNDKIDNILNVLELHTRVFSTAEQKRIVDLVYELQEKGKNHELGGEYSIKRLALSSVYLFIVNLKLMIQEP